MYAIIKFMSRGCVAQWTIARGYEPRCRGFESLLAHFTILNAQVPFVDLVHFLLNSTSRK